LILLLALKRQDIVAKVASESDFVINVSEDGKKSLIKNVTGMEEEKIHVIRNGVNLNRFKKSDESSRRAIKKGVGISEDQFIVLTPTRVAPYKGIDFLKEYKTSLIASFLLLAKTFQALFKV